MRQRRHRQLLEVNATINVTNLLDTAFILLITFMLVAPRLSQHGLKVDLPPVERTGSTDVDQSKILTVVIQKPETGETNEKVYLLDRRKAEHRLDLSDPKGREEFISTIRTEKGNDDKFAVVIEGDMNSRFGVGVQVISAIQQAGVTNIGIATKPESSETPSSPAR